MLLLTLCFVGFFPPCAELSEGSHGWSKNNYVEKFDASTKYINDNVDRIDASQVSIEEFQERYEKTYTPVVVTNCQTDWAASYKWNPRVHIVYLHPLISRFSSFSIIKKKFQGAINYLYFLFSLIREHV